MKNTLLSFLIAVTCISNAQAQCADPANLQTNYANNVTTFNWSAVNGATGYVFELKQSWDGWAEWMDTVYTNSYALTDIMQSISIDWRVKALCNGTESGYATYSNFVVPCPVASNLRVTNLAITSATLNWSAPAGYRTHISDFIVSYRRSGLNTWTSAHTSDTTRNITGLLPGTTYEWRVTTTCPYFNSSSVNGWLTTLTCTSAGNNAQEWITRFKVGSINRNSGAESGGYINVNTTTNLAAGSNNNAQIRVGHTGGFNNKVFKVYIDYNKNTIYEETEVAYGPATISSSQPLSFTLSIPSNISNGVRGMRVIMARNGTNITGCMNGHNGETEDYKVNITGGTSNKGGGLAVSAEVAEEEKINIYPNPVTDKLNIQLPAAVSIVTVYDMMGKKVYQQQASNAIMQINVGQWPATQYIVEATYTDGHKQVLRFVKQ